MWAVIVVISNRQYYSVCFYVLALIDFLFLRNCNLEYYVTELVQVKVELVRRFVFLIALENVMLSICSFGKLADLKNNEYAFKTFVFLSLIIVIAFFLPNIEGKKVSIFIVLNRKATQVSCFSV